MVVLSDAVGPSLLILFRQPTVSFFSLRMQACFLYPKAPILSRNHYNCFYPFFSDMPLSFIFELENLT